MVWAGMLSLVLLSSCSSMNTKIGGLFNMDTDLDLTFIADKNINPDTDAVPSPLFIRMYELKSDKAFKNADFIDLYERDKEVLGDDMLGKQRLKRLIPGEKREKDFVLDPQTRFVGLFAEFQQYKDATYKVIIPVEPTNVVASSSVVRISGNIVSASR
ncbi:MAG: type VI secretion system lipoprotein TssJ [Gammaproteobacteria bacterium]|nr:type VI secretion system lipoprotein TssJ [Gammaproteobacteria bacterium]